MLPYFAFLWALSLVLFYNTLYKELYDKSAFKYVLPPLIILIAVIVFIILPIRSCINRCTSGNTFDDKSYHDYFSTFIADFDTENPVTKKEG